MDTKNSINWIKRFKEKMKYVTNGFSNNKCPVKGYIFGEDIDNNKCRTDCDLYAKCDKEWERRYM